MNFKLYDKKYAIYRLNGNESIPSWINTQEFCSITNTEDELSIVCVDEDIKTDIKCEKDFRLLKIEGPLDFSLVGIISNISTILADNNISIFAISTYDTDYILVKDENIEKTINLLKENGHVINEK